MLTSEILNYRINALLDNWKKKIAERDSSAKEKNKVSQSIQETLTPAINLLDNDNETALSLAVTNGHEEAVIILLAAGANVGTKTREESNVLHWPIGKDNSGIFPLLLAKAAKEDVHALNDSGNTPLMEAIEREAWNSATALLELDPSKFELDLEHKYSDKRTALGLASWKGEEKVVKLLLEKGASRKATDDRDDIPLHDACWQGHLDIALLLIDFKTVPTVVEGKNGEMSVEHEDEVPHAKLEDNPAMDPILEVSGVNHKNELGMTPLFYAAMRGLDTVVGMLLGKGANADEKDNSNESILGCAARSDDEGTFLKILNNVKDINVADMSKQTPLLWLIRHNMEQAAIALLSKDHVDIETHPDNHLGPLHEATRRCSLSVINVLLSKTDNVWGEDPQGRTALHIAAATGRLEVLTSLLNTTHKGKPLFEQEDKQGRNVLHHAACSGTLEIVRSLIQGPEGETVINKSDNDGWTPLHWAAKIGNEMVFAHLLSYGADPNIQETLNNETVLQLLQRYNHKVLAEKLPNLALQHGKPTDEGLEFRRVGKEWKDTRCDGCYTKVSVHSSLLFEKLSDWFLVQPIRGALFRCQECEEIWHGFDFCEKCKSSSAETHPGHTFKKEELEDEYVDEYEFESQKRRLRRRLERAMYRTGHREYNFT